MNTLPDTPDYDREDTPLFIITVKVPVSGHTPDRAIEYLEHVLTFAKRDDECEIYDWDIEDWEEA
jgi:hypothetical protein